LLLINKNDNKHECVILLNANDSNIFEQFCKLVKPLEEHGYRVNIRLRSKRKDILGLEEIENKKQYQYVCDLFGQDITGDFTLYNFAWNCQYIYTTANLFYKKCRNALFIEEGALTAVNPPQSKAKSFVKKMQGGSVDFYKDKKLVGIYVQRPEIYFKEWKDKLNVLDVKKILDGLDEITKHVIVEIFMGDFINSVKNQLKDTGIIYTQPLSEDGFITEKEKIFYFTQMVDYYSKYGTPVLKLHPRDTSDYQLENKCTILPAFFPSEILTLLDIHFKYAIGICTSAVPTTDADYKININENFLKDLKFKLIHIE
jgi:hypothetical protein